jgi:hypothetical protein
MGDGTIPIDSTQEILIEQYKAYIDKLNQVAKQRFDISNFYITILSGMLVILAFIISNKLYLEVLHFLLISIAIFGLAICLTWYCQIDSYRKLFIVKYKIIKEIEEKLVFPIHKREWDLLKEDKKFYEFMQIEKIPPILLGFAYLLLLVLAIYIIWVCPNHTVANICNLTGIN